ncbi:hypothetical protein [Microcoleus sp. FACHB-SPT15]|uniref:hypothetical protein n=1 Tax=Microcoleus sp. FACHB-SPT15 TaxID=2692830 RepID=UPI0018EF8DDF|nr:hypothetical protein [Microcoleus sp. FACHB-SPT15]
MSADYPRFNALSTQLWINLLGASSLVTFLGLGVSSIKPAQANPAEQQPICLAQSQASLPTHLRISCSQENLKATALRSEVKGSAVAVKPTSNSSAGVETVEQPATNLVPENTFVQQAPVKVNAVAPQQLEPLTVSAIPSATLDAQKRSHSPANQPLVVGYDTTEREIAIEGLPTPPISSTNTHNNIEQNLGQLAPSHQSDCSLGKTCGNTLTPVIPESTFSGSNPVLAQLPYSQQTLPPLPVPATPIPVGSDSSNTKLGQLPYFPQPPNPVPAPTMVYPAGGNNYNPALGQYPYYPQTVLLVPVPATGLPAGGNGYNPTLGQYPYYPQTVLLVPVPATALPAGGNNYNPALGQYPYYPQTAPQLPPNAMVGSNYNPALGQYPYYPQTPPQLPPNAMVGSNYNPALGQYSYYPQTAPQLPPNAMVGSNYNPALGQYPYYPQTPPQLPPNAMVGSNYNPALGQYPYYPQTPPQLPPYPMVGSNYNPAGQSPYYPQTPPQLPPNPMVGSNYNPAGQSPYYPQTVPQLPAPLPANPVAGSNYNPALGQSPYYLQNYPQTVPQLPTPNPNIIPPASPPRTELGAAPTTQQPPELRSTALSSPSLQLQGLYIDQGDESSARARLSGLYPLSPQALFGATLDLTSEENTLADSPNQGLNINELYFATAPIADLPNLRFVVGQLDLTSYFDRNSFAKDGATHFFNPVFQTNPALSTTGISSRLGGLVNWTITDNIEAKAAVFSSAQNLGDFALDGFAGEIGIRYGNAIIRGTYATDRDAGSDDGFREIFQNNRDTDSFGLLPSDREESYGVNAEVFVPELSMGVFGRYGRYENRELDQGGDTYSLGISFSDVFSENDRLGLAYGRSLSNDQLRRDRGDEIPDVLELFYDFRFLPNIRLGFTLQQRDGFSDTYGGFRVKTEFDVTPGGE